MNILDAFIKKHGQFILVIIGKPCTNKSYVAKEFADDLKLPLINMNKYYVDGTYVEKTVNDTSYKLYDHPDNINWDAVNSEVETKKTERGGVVVYGNYIDSAKITFKPNFVFFVNMNNNLCKTILIKNK
jgi:uridine kinase